jgi:epoxyqueuosine reductase QueG
MMSNKQFKTKYQRTAAGWRGKKQLQKNGEIVLKNISGGNSRIEKTER